MPTSNQVFKCESFCFRFQLFFFFIINFWIKHKNSILIAIKWKILFITNLSLSISEPYGFSNFDSIISNHRTNKRNPSYIRTHTHTFKILKLNCVSHWKCLRQFIWCVCFINFVAITTAILPNVQMQILFSFKTSVVFGLKHM